jgi:hypothetical protein
MLKFIDFMKLSSLNEDESVFRSINLKLIKEKTNYEESIKKISKSFPDALLMLEIKKKINNVLKQVYKGNYKFDFCIDEGISINKLKIKERYKQKLLTNLLKSNDKITKIKNKFEN